MPNPKSTSHFWKVHFWICLLPVFLSTISLSANSFPLQYGSHRWQTEEGLPENAVQTMVQTRDGFLWVGLPTGLARFDGMRFLMFDAKVVPEMKAPFIFALCETKDGSLWIGSNDSGLMRMKDGKVTRYSQTNGLSSDYVRALYEDHEGTLWIGLLNGLAKFQNETLTAVTNKESWSQNAIRSIASKDGQLWLALGAGLYRLENGVTTRFATTNGMVNNTIRSVCYDRKGDLWIGTAGSLTLFKAGKFTHYTKKDGLLDDNVTTVFEDSRGHLWIGTYGGLHRMVDGKIAPEMNNEGTAYDAVSSILEDREGNIWIGAKDGLFRLRPKRFTTYTQQQGLAHNNVISVCEDRAGDLWLGTWGGGWQQMKGKKELLKPNALQESKGPRLVLGICEGRDGSIWFGSDFDGGLYQLKKEKLTRFGKSEGLIDPAIRVVYEDSKTNLWVGGRGGLYQMKGKKFVRYAMSEGLAGDDIRVILEDYQGDLWIGTQRGLSRHRAGTFRNFTQAEGLPHDFIVSLYEDSAKSLWIGTYGGGICRIKRQESGVRSQESGGEKEKPASAGALLSPDSSLLSPRFTSYTMKQGLFRDAVFEIVEDDLGYLWMTCRNGIFRVRTKDFDDLDQGLISRLTCFSYGRTDGLMSTECISVAKPASCQDRDGRLWFATAKGLAMTDPKVDIKENQVVPPVVIEEMLVDKKLRSHFPFPVAHSSADALSKNVKSSLDVLEIPPGHGELEFHYAALSFQAPERNRFKYKLEGVDRDWVEADTRRSAFYNNIRPGEYQFRVLACNNDGVWNSEGASVAFVLQPHFWQMGWFIFGVIAGSVGIVGASVRYVTRKRMQWNLERLEQQHALERERNRIARDIHDDLGANLTQIGYLSEVVKRDVDCREKVLAHTEKIAGAAHELVEAMDEIVWAVNPENDNLRRVAGYIFKSAEEFMNNSEVRCRFERPESLPEYPVSAEVRHNVFLIVKEALNNIVKHARATEVWIRLTFAGRELEIVLEDNGQGFSPTVGEDQFGNGLRNMKKRMENVGGRFELTSKPGAGTKIRLGIRL